MASRSRKTKTPRTKLDSNAAHYQRLREEGWRRVTFLASPVDLANLEKLKAHFGGVAAAMEAILAAAAADLEGA